MLALTVRKYSKPAKDNRIFSLHTSPLSINQYSVIVSLSFCWRCNRFQ